MTKNIHLLVAGSIAAVILSVPFATRIAAQGTTITTTSTNQTNRAKDPGVRAGDPAAGKALAGLTPGQFHFFNEGKDAFEEIGFVHDPPANGDAGLGPGFNSNSCVSCHSFPATGGTSPRVNPQLPLATLMGARNSVPWFIKPDGPVLEARFKYNRNGTRDGGVHNLFTIAGRQDAENCNLRQEDFSNRDNISFRTATPVFGLGLVEAISETTLIGNLAANGGPKSQLGISGKLNVNGNDGTTTRFGWKAQNKSLAIFAAEAYNVEMGVSSQLFPQERNESPNCMYNPEAEDGTDFETGDSDDIVFFSAFMRFSAPPARAPLSASIRAGEDQFTEIGCALCHTPSFKTGRNNVAALNEKTVPLFSDLAVHAMGPDLADDIEQGAAAGDEFRTAPLWGLGQRIFFLHDGRTTDLVQAIQAHSSEAGRRFRASEANGVIRRFNRLTTQQQQDLLNFLRSL